MGGDHGCCKTPYGAEDSPHRVLLAPVVSREPWPRGLSLGGLLARPNCLKPEWVTRVPRAVVPSSAGAAPPWPCSCPLALQPAEQCRKYAHFFQERTPPRGQSCICNWLVAANGAWAASKWTNRDQCGSENTHCQP